MRTHKRQTGMTMWSATFVIAVLGASMFLSFKMIPPYVEDIKIKRALDGLARDPGVASMTRNDMVGALAKRFDIDNVTDVDLTKSLFIEARGRTRVIRVSYERVVPLFYNVSALIDFNHVREVRGVE